MTRFETNDGRRGFGGRDVFEVGVSSILGAAIGAGLMYLLDPDAGAKRRRKLSRTAQQAMASSAETFSHSLENLTERARNLGSAIQERLEDRRQLIEPSYAQARHSIEDLSERARKAVVSARKSLLGRKYLPSSKRYLRSHEHKGVSPVTMILTACGAFAAGCGIMYFMDPERGRARRHAIKQRAGEITGRAQEYAHDLGVKAKETARQAGIGAVGGGDKSLEERVRSAVARVTPSGSIGISCHEGVCILTGRCDPGQIAQVLEAARKVGGVQRVENRIETRSEFRPV